MSVIMETLSLAERSRQNNSDFYEHTISDTLDSHRTEGSYSDLRNFEDLIVEPGTSKKGRVVPRRRISNKFTLLLLCIMFLLILICVIAFAFMLEVYRLDQELAKLKMGIYQCDKDKKALNQRLERLESILNLDLDQTTSTKASVEKRDTTNNEDTDKPILPKEVLENEVYVKVNTTNVGELPQIFPSSEPVLGRETEIYNAGPLLPPSFVDDNWLESEFPIRGSYRYDNNRGPNAIEYQHLGKKSHNHILESVAPAWPAGSYCLLADGPCPAGFQANSASLSGIKLSSKMSSQYYSVFGYSDIYVHGRVASLRIIACCKVPS